MCLIPLILLGVALPIVGFVLGVMATIYLVLGSFDTPRFPRRRRK